MHIQESDDVADSDEAAINVGHRPACFYHPPHRYVAGNDRVWHTGQVAVMQMHIGAAHFGKDRLQQNAARLHVGGGQVLHFNRSVGGSHHCGERHLLAPYGL